MYYVYIYLDPRKEGNYIYGDYIFDFEPMYVGKGNGYQHTSHIRYAKKHLKTKGHKQKSLREMVEENVDPIIIKLIYNITEEEAFDWECEYIKSIGRLCDKTGPLTNLTKGGDGVKTIFITNEHLENQSIRSKNNKYAKGLKHTKKAKQKISDGNKGLKRSDETKNLLRTSKLGKKRECFSDEWILNMSKAKLGHKHSEETKRKMSNSAKGKEHPHSNETKQKISKSRMGHKTTSETVKKILISKGKIYTFIDPTGIVYSDVLNLKEFCNIHNLKVSAVYGFLKYERKSMKSGWMCFKQEIDCDR